MIASGDKQGTDCWTLAPNVRPASFSLWRAAITKPPLLCVSAAIKKCTYAQHPKQMDIVVTDADNVDATRSRFFSCLPLAENVYAMLGYLQMMLFVCAR
jgi:hypothetical protein